MTLACNSKTLFGGRSLSQCLKLWTRRESHVVEIITAFYTGPPRRSRSPALKKNIMILLWLDGRHSVAYDLSRHLRSSGRCVTPGHPPSVVTLMGAAPPPLSVVRMCVPCVCVCTSSVCGWCSAGQGQSQARTRAGTALMCAYLQGIGSWAARVGWVLQARTRADDRSPLTVPCVLCVQWVTPPCWGWIMGHTLVRVDW